ncbi:MAG: hypothetical protein HKN18_13650 [Silicimonas sp.]|nr:hypothetical protein [Silicimonas sp.]
MTTAYQAMALNNDYAICAMYEASAHTGRNYFDLSLKPGWIAFIITTDKKVLDL